MKVMILGVSAAALVGGWFLLSPYTPPNIYPVAPEAAYAKLMEPVKTGDGDGPYDRLEVYPSGNGKSEVRWDTGMKGSGRGCTILIAPVEGGRTQLDMTCPNIGEGAAAGLTTVMRRNKMIELADATMTGRAYDAERARGATAAKWPKDDVEHGTIFDAQSEAFQMQAEEMRSLREMEKAEAERPKPKPPGW
ncbi:hypothetical protein [Sphingomonas sp. Y38-1Y]|uniref:hypothetical protein n=1 Tax=Sphingomonas sp. Y38-1Y TaxID=3078265 RepID=UPI0028E2314C|nr:hypothetical protein [Sphingomonas sp. Y38-1Y]